MFKTYLALSLIIFMLFVSVMSHNHVSAEESTGMNLIRQDVSNANIRKDMLDIAKELRPPGCLHSMTADYCTLTTAYELRAEITGMLAEGKQSQLIIDELVLKYGKRILAAPKAEGFHLLAWIFPGIGIVAGGLMIGLLLFVWVRHNRTRTIGTPSSKTVSVDQEMQIQEELKHWL